MSYRRFFWIVAAVVVFQYGALAQVRGPALSPGQHVSPFEALSLPPVPYDPLELVNSDAQPVQDAEERAAVITMLANAHNLSNVRAQAYDLKTTFTSFGSSPSDGRWILEDTSPSRGVYRWTAQGPSYSALYLTINGLLASNQPADAIPLRLVQAREAIFYIYPEVGPNVSLRAATGDLNGLAVRCVLVDRLAGFGRPSQGGRGWLESEYCVDPKSGLLATYSPAPGLFIHYDYSNAVHFHKTIIPGTFTISVAGRAIIEAHTESATDPPNADNPIFSASGLKTVGAGAVMTPPLRITSSIGGTHVNGASSAVQMVVLHGIVSPENHFIEGEFLATSDATLNEAAMNHANKWPSCSCQVETQPGTTPRTREAIFVVEFFPGLK